MKPDSLLVGPSPLQRLDLSPLTLAAAVGILLFAWLVSSVLRRALSRAVTRARIDVGIGYALGRLLHLTILVIGAMLALNLLGFGLGNLAVVAGALGIGIGFGLQSIAANFVSGLVLLFERPIRVGDRVSLGTLETDAVNTVNGYVRAIRLRATTVVTPDNIALIVPNLEFVTKTVVNWSLGELRMRIRLAIGVAFNSDLDLVRQIMDEVARAHPGTLKDPPPEIRMIATGDSSLQFQLLVWIPDPRQRGRVESDLRWELVRRFREEGVIIPLPQREVRVFPGELVRPGELQS